MMARPSFSLQDYSSRQYLIVSLLLRAKTPDDDRVASLPSQALLQVLVARR